MMFIGQGLISFLLVVILAGLTVNSCEVEISLPRLPKHEREGAPRTTSVGKLIPKLIPSASTTTTTTSGPTEQSTIHPAQSPGSSNTVVCYYNSWSGYRSASSDAGQLVVENIDPSLCTHLIYNFAGLDADSKIKSIDPSSDLDRPYGKGGYRRFNALKRLNSSLKTLIGIGGWNEGSLRYSVMASNSTARSIFASSVAQFIESHGFDGVDIAWEYPSVRGGSTQDKQTYVALLSDLAQALKPRNYLITASVSANKLAIDSGYDVPRISGYLDLINILAFDYHGGWEGKTDHHAPLFARSAEGLDMISNVNYSVHYWIGKGAAPQKLVLGLAAFGRGFTIKDADNDCTVGVKVVKPSQEESNSSEMGSYGFNQICAKQKTEKWISHRDPNYFAPFTCKDNRFIGYEDRESIGLKARFARLHGLAGIGLWSIDNDDFNGLCFAGAKYPLLRAAVAELKGTNTSFPTNVIVTPSTTTPKPDNGLWSSTTTDRPWSWTYSTAPTIKQQTSSTPSTWWPQPSSTVSPSTWWPQPSATLSTSRTSPSTSTTTWAPPSSTALTHLSTSISPPQGKPAELICKYPGTFIHPTDCRKFYRCVRIAIEEKYKMYEYTCPPNTLFDVDSRNCLWDYLVNNCRDTRNRQ